MATSRLQVKAIWENKLVGIMPGGTLTVQTGLSQDQEDISHHDSFTVAGKGVL